MQSLIGTERLHSSVLCVCSQVFNANVFIMIMMLTMTMTMTMTMAMTKAMMMTMGTVQGRHHPTADGLSALTICHSMPILSLPAHSFDHHHHHCGDHNCDHGEVEDDDGGCHHRSFKLAN